LSAFCRSEPTLRFVSFAILTTGVFAFECDRNSFTSALVYSRRTIFFAFLATYCSLIVRRLYQKSPERRGPGLNVSVGASLLGQFGNDSINLERVDERRIEPDQSNAPPTRFSLRQTTWLGRFNCSA
jgi:hypothetical protein